MTALIIVLSVLLFLLLLWLFLVSPSPCKKGARAFTFVRYAHRGLHGAGVAENSLSAFRLAVGAGYGIELDVRVSKDGKVVICHDPDLRRVAGLDRRVKDMTAEELAAVSLCGTKDGVPLLTDVLALVNGRVPLLIEIKEDTAADRDVTPKLLNILKEYRGPVMIESFNPLSLSRVRKAAPHIVRGLLCDHYFKDKKMRTLQFFAMERFFLNFLCRPQFIAYDIDERNFLPYRIFSAVFRPVRFAWTVRSAEVEADARAHGFDDVIFEHYIPEEMR